MKSSFSGFTVAARFRGGSSFRASEAITESLRVFRVKSTSVIVDVGEVGKAAGFLSPSSSVRSIMRGCFFSFRWGSIFVYPELALVVSYYPTRGALEWLFSGASWFAFMESFRDERKENDCFRSTCG